MKKFAPILLALVGTFAGLTGEQGDASRWAADAGLLGVAVWGTVEALRATLLTKLDGASVLILALATGLGLASVLGVGGYYGEYQGAASITEWALQGLTATFGAFIADAALKKGGGNPLLEQAREK